MEKYTSLDVKEKIINDKNTKQEDIDKEKEKIVLSNDAFAVCDFIEQLNKSLEHLRISSIMRR